MRSSFSGFYVAKSGIQAAQANLQITGQNMSNVNTEGYTRQRVDTSAVASSSNNMRYSNKADLSVGGGVECNSTSQVRDPYLDVRYRMENAKVGDATAQLDTLTELENMFDEITSDGLDAQFKDLTSQLQTFVSSSSDSVVENIVKTSSLLLVQSFNNTSEHLNEIRNQETDSLETNKIADVNNLLKNISELNKEIKSSDISDCPALELMDQRNTMIDKLSAYVNIEVSANTVSVGGGRTVSELSIDLVSGDQKFNLLENDQYKQFGLVKDSNDKVKTPVTIVLNNANGIAVTASNDGSASLTGGNINSYLTSGALSGSLDMLNGKGVFADVSESTKNGIGYYQGLLDNLAQSFANIMNAANSTTTTVPYNKPLFTTTDGTTTNNVTAANISLSKAWNESTDAYITTSKTTGNAGSNILSMISALSEERTYTTNGGTAFFNGSFQECVSNISSTLGLQIENMDRQNATYTATLGDINTDRLSVSSVDTNEEGINLIMYNQALTASSRFMTTLDEALDTIINNMGRVGR